jgi:hypothetical protein
VCSLKCCNLLQSFYVVNQVLEKENTDSLKRFVWNQMPNNVIRGRRSLGGGMLGKKPDLNLGIGNTNIEKGAGNAKNLYVLHEGRNSPDMESADMNQTDRPLLVTPEENPKVDLIQNF